MNTFHPAVLASMSLSLMLSILVFAASTAGDDTRQAVYALLDAPAPAADSETSPAVVRESFDSYTCATCPRPGVCGPNRSDARRFWR